MSGFEHNAVCPVGLAHGVPIVVAYAITRLAPGVVWLGGGEVHVKLKVNVAEFVACSGAVVGDVTEPLESW